MSSFHYVNAFKSLKYLGLNLNQVNNEICVKTYFIISVRYQNIKTY